MTRIANVLRGKQAKINGQAFENILFGHAYKYGWLPIKIPDGCRQLGPQKLIRVPTPFDFMFIKQGRAIFADAKSTNAKYFKFSQITPHQLDVLKGIHDHGFVAGYIVHFTGWDQIVFYSGDQLYALSKGHSLTPADGLHLGSTELMNIGRACPEPRGVLFSGPIPGNTV